MAEKNALQWILDEQFLGLEPIVVITDELYVKSDRSSDDVDFVTALGVRHHLRRFCSCRTIEEQLVRRNAAVVRHLIYSGLARGQGDNRLDDLRYFVEALLPAFQSRDWTEEFALDALPELVKPRLLDATPGQIDELSRSVPPPVLPSPSYLLLGRFRMLRPDPAAAGGDHVRHGDLILGPTGETIPIGEVSRQWRQTVRTFVAQAADRLIDASDTPAPGPRLVAAREEIARTGCLQRGDVIFLPGTTARVGHIVPPHYNRVLGRHSRRDLAMVAPLTRPPRMETPEVYTRDGQGRWSPLRLPHGLCLGGHLPDVRPETPGLALLSFLRWSACRIATNGAFHVNDDYTPEYES
jgi:hypothetical protein